ncbi:MAG: hypothetical protein RL701_4389 [Pseudomonadota bacterium]
MAVASDLPTAASSVGSDSDRVRGRYRVERELARGGMGIVYRAFDLVRERSIALKRTLQSSANDNGARAHQLAELLEREYRTLITLKHPRIIEVFDYGVDEQGPYYTMELLDGGDLRTKCPLPWREACSYVRDIASSLALLHARGLIHRDLSPANVWVGSDGRAKLLDFGALVPFGRHTRIAGTPACMAPEVLDMAELDQRADLYALGATAYYALSGRMPYQAGALDQLRAVWAGPAPTRLSALVPELPPALEELVSALISLDPLQRPASAGEVIDRLTALAELERDDDPRVVLSYLRNPTLVGRHDAQTRLLARLEGALRRRGSLTLIEGSVGYGKSSLLLDLQREALVRGIQVLSVNARAQPGTLQTCAALVKQVASELDHTVSASLFPAAEQSASDSPQRIEAELQRSKDRLSEFFLRLCVERALLIVVDDAEHADAHSLAVLATLAKHATSTRLLLALSADADSLLRQAALRPILRVAKRVHLAALTVDQLEQLAGSLFGAIAGVKALAAWLEQQTLGSPMLCMELLAELVEQGTIRYVQGTWLIPRAFGDRHRPTVVAALERRAARLSEQARQLACCMSARRIALSRELAQSLGSEALQLRAADCAALLAELARERVLIGDDEQLAFSHPYLQKLLYDQLDEQRRTRVHLWFAKQLSAHVGADPSLRFEIACHLSFAGEFDAARSHLRSVEDVTRDLSTLIHATPDLLALLSQYERLGWTEHRKLPVTIPLTIVGLYVDPALHERHGEAALGVLYERSGMHIASRVAPLLGALPALIIGIFCAFVWYLCSSRRERLPMFVYPIAYFGVCASRSTQFFFRVQRHDSAPIVRQLAWLKGLTPRLAARIVYDGASSDAYYRGRWAFGRRDTASRLQLLERVIDLDQLSRQQFVDMNLFWAGRIELLSVGREPIAIAERLSKSAVGFYRTAAEFLRFAFHLSRGELSAANAPREAMDQLTALHGSVWIADLLVALEFVPFHLSGDVLGLKRSVELLQTLVPVHPELTLHLEIARAMYLGHLQRPERALQIYASIAAQIEPFEDPYWSQAQGHWAQCLNQVGQYAQALERCHAALDAIAADKEDFVVAYQQLEREAAVALSGLGRHAEAALLLDQLLAVFGREEQPLIVGLLHRDRARVAAAAGDAPTFQTHAVAVHDRFRSTGNPALIAQLRGLDELAKRAGLGLHAMADPEQLISKQLSLLHSLESTHVEPMIVAQRVLDHVVELVGATRARLYVTRAKAAELSAQRGPDTWAEPLAADISELIASLDQEAETVFGSTDDLSVTAGPSARHTLVPLLLDVAGKPAVMGVLALGDAVALHELTLERKQLFARMLLLLNPATLADELRTA